MRSSLFQKLKRKYLDKIVLALIPFCALLMAQGALLTAQTPADPEAPPASEELSGVLQEMPPDLPPDMPPDALLGMPDDMQTGMPDNMPPGTLDDMPPMIPPGGSSEEDGTYPQDGADELSEEGRTVSEESLTAAVQSEQIILTDEVKETISMDLRGIDINEFLKVLSKKLKISIIPSKKVTGRISLFLNNISYEEALDVLVLSQGLAYENIVPNIIMIMNEAEYEALYGKKFNDKRVMKRVKLAYAQPSMVFAALSNLKSTVGNITVDEATGTIFLIDTPEKLAEMLQVVEHLDKPAVTEIFELQYAKATDISEKISAMLAGGSGKVIIDDRSNTVIVTDLPGNMLKIKQAVLVLDQETKEVFINAEILEITLRDRLQTGVSWDKIMQAAGYGMLLTGTFPSGLGAGLVSVFTSEKPFDFDMQALSTIADVRILSSPRIAVINNEEATMMVGTREAYVTGTISQSGESTVTSDTVEFIDVGVQLSVVPTINRDGYITMKIKPEISSVTDTLTTGDEDAPRSQIPIVSTSNAETSVKVKDGCTIMIAGLKQSRDSENIDGVPFLTKIPIVNWFAGKRDAHELQTEIIIFLTPHIISGDQMRSWDTESIKKFPSQLHPENRSIADPKVQKSQLKELF